MKHSHTQFISFTLGIFVSITIAFCASVAFASEITPDKVVELANQDRIQQGVQPLQVNAALTQAAQAKADDMVNNAYFAHTSPQGITPWYWFQQSGYDYRYAGENLAIHFGNAEDQETAWMASIKHRENILNPKYQDIGVAVAHTIQKGQPTVIVVQLFGFPSGVIPPTPSAKMPLSISEPTNNILLPSAVKSLQTAQVPVSSHNTLEVMRPWIQWSGFVVVVMIMIGGISVIRMNRKMISYAWLHKEHTWQYKM